MSQAVAPLPKAIGMIRVSRVGDREGDRFVSPGEQRERIVQACKVHGLDLLEVVEELDISAGLPLARRPGLGKALTLIEAGLAHTLVVAYFDRLVRHLGVQRELTERIEKAGGGILAVDVGRVRADTASHWLSSTMLGAVAEYYRRMVAERTLGAKQRAVERGVPPAPRIVPGYRRTADRRLEVHPEEAETVRAAFEMRASGGSWQAIRTFLHRHGIERTNRGVTLLIQSRVVLGELHFGKFVNLNSHPPIVDRDLWQRAQRRPTLEYRGPQSDRLLARTRLLFCANCGARMVAGSQVKRGVRYAIYRCAGNTSGVLCRQKVSISADVVESVVMQRTRELLAAEQGSASNRSSLEAAAAELEQRQTTLDNAIHAFTGLEDVAVATERLRALHEAVGQARERLDDLEARLGSRILVRADRHWDHLTLDEHRQLIKSVIDRVIVKPGRGKLRVEIRALE
jgi:DNA invertase Pin-like site-specific DNA recombinase